MDLSVYLRLNKLQAQQKSTCLISVDIPVLHWRSFVCFKHLVTVTEHIKHTRTWVPETHTSLTILTN